MEIKLLITDIKNTEYYNCDLITDDDRLAFLWEFPNNNVKDKLINHYVLKVMDLATAFNVSDFTPIFDYNEDYTLIIETLVPYEKYEGYNN